MDAEKQQKDRKGIFAALQSAITSEETDETTQAELSKPKIAVVTATGVAPLASRPVPAPLGNVCDVLIMFPMKCHCSRLPYTCLKLCITKFLPSHALLRLLLWGASGLYIVVTQLILLGLPHVMYSVSKQTDIWFGVFKAIFLTSLFQGNGLLVQSGPRTLCVSDYVCD